MNVAWPSAKWIFLAQVFSTLAMVGVIWFVQLVHYPLFNRVGTEAFVGFQACNLRKTGWVVIPLMLIELATALLLIWQRPEGILPDQVWIGVGLLVAIWLSTALIQAPLHRRLSLEFLPGTHRKLVMTNWIRTIAWSARGWLILWMLAG
jgi:hypothetical protein